MERYLKKFLDELPKQTIFDQLQVVLDHNEPTEQERTWVREFEQKYPGVIKHIIVNPVEPIGTSMNRCIEEADGEYVAIWNVDDLRTPDSLEKQVNKLNSEKGLGVVHGNFVIVNHFGSKTGKYIDHTIHKPGSKEFTRSMVLGPFFMWRKELCEKVGFFDEQMVSGADFDFAIRLGANCNIGTVYGILGYYLDEGKGASTRGDGNQVLERTLIEMRYGIDDKIEQSIVPLVKNKDYKIDKIYFNRSEHNVCDFIKNFNEFKKENSKP